MSAQSDKGKPIATFQSDESVRKRILSLIKKKPPKSTTEDTDFACSKRSLELEGEDDLVSKPIKVVKTYGRNNNTVDGEVENEIHMRAQCSICGQIYNSAPLLERHVKRVHLKERRHLCQYCDFRGYYRREVLLHERRKHTLEKSVKCPYCDYMATDNQSLYSHLSTHSNNRAFKCDTCPYMCGWKKQLIRHAQAHASCDRVTCSICGVVSRDQKQDLVHFSVEHSVRTTVNMARLHVGHKNSKTNKMQNNSMQKHHINTTSGCNFVNNGAVKLGNRLLSPSIHQSNGVSYAKQSSNNIMLSSNSLGLTLANLLSMDTESFQTVSNGTSDTDPQLIISKDEVANHVQVLNVSDLVRKQNRGEINGSFTPETLQFKPRVHNPKPTQDIKICQNVEVVQHSKPHVSIMKSVLRSDIKERLLAATKSAALQQSIHSSDVIYSDDVSNQNDVSMRDDAIASDDVIVPSDVTNSNDVTHSKSTMNELNITPSNFRVALSQQSEFDILNTGSELGPGNMKIESGLAESDISDIDIESEFFTAVDSTQSNIAAVSDTENLSPAVCMSDNTGQMDVLRTELSQNHGLSNLDYIEQELQSFIEKVEKQNAAAKQENNNVLCINSADVHEIINLIESKMNGDTCSTLASEQQPVESATEPTGETQVQVVLQVSDDVNNAGACGETPSCSTPVASVELSVLDQILKNLLQSKTENASKITVRESESEKVFEINLDS